MHRQTVARRTTLVILCGMLLCIACGQIPAPTPQPSVTPLPKATSISTPGSTPTAARQPSPTPVSAPTATQEPVDTIVQGRLSTYTLTVPSEWHVTDLTKIDPDTVAEQRQELAIDEQLSETMTERLVQFIDADGTNGLEAIGILRSAPTIDSTTPVPTLFTLLVVPHHHLTLEQYLSTAIQTIEDGKLEHQGIDDMLHFDHRPVAVLQFSSVVLIDNEPEVETTNYQAVLFDQAAANLIVISFSTPVESFAQQVDQFKQLIRSLKLPE
ncbi:hypothetical protein KFU94_17725 [Chloroflexi bacterium TSY]|nr:hypothetical protein [Chloroflexi bacterium TSY]